MIELGDLHIKDIGRDIISIVGLNGSGKSLLMSTMHPFSSSSRFDKSYPIKIGEFGYKKIVFEDKGRYFITEHEYTPKGDTHSAKSYLSIIENGIETKLNPTGHNVMYKELVEKYMKYDTKTDKIANLSESFNGITNSSALDRKKIIESTIDAERIEYLKKNVANILKEKKGATKGLTQYRIQLLSSRNEKEERMYLTNIESNITEIENNMPNLLNEKLDIESKLKDMGEDYKDIDIYELSSVIELLKEGNYDTLSQARETFLTLSSNIEVKKQELINISDKLNTQELYRKAYLDEIELKNKIKEQEELIKDEVENYLSIANKEIDKDTLTQIQGYFFDINYVNNLILDYSIPRDEVIIIVDDIGRYIKYLDNKIKFYEDNIKRYNKLSSSVIKGDNYSDIPYKDNCNSCSLYKAYVVDKKWIEDNKSLYNSWQDGIKHLNRVKESFMRVFTISLEDEFNFIKHHLRENILRNRNTIDLVNGFMMNSFNNSNFYSIYRSIEESDTLLEALRGYINDYKLQIDKLHHEYDENSYNSLIMRKTALVEEINKMKERHNFLYKYTRVLELKGELSIKTMKELIFIRETKVSYDNKSKELKASLVNVEETIAKKQKELSTLISEKARIKEVIRNLDVTNKSILTYNKEIESLGQLKDILERDIPFYLLKGHLEFIENEVNNILDNLFPYSIKIIVEDEEIVISVLRHKENRVTNDVRNCSSGEKTIIGLVLNACILHILGYGILCLDEVDAQLDEVNRHKFSDVIHIIMRRLNINQVFCISHNLTSHIDNSITLTLGDVSSLTIIGETKSVYERR